MSLHKPPLKPTRLWACVVCCGRSTRRSKQCAREARLCAPCLRGMLRGIGPRVLVCAGPLPF